MKEVYTSTMEHNASTKYMINAKTALLDLERLNRSITIHTFTRLYRDRFSCVDTPNKPITLNNFVCSGGLIYYKENAYSWKTISFDEISAIYTDDLSGTALA